MFDHEDVTRFESNPPPLQRLEQLCRKRIASFDFLG